MIGGTFFGLCYLLIQPLKAAISSTFGGPAIPVALLSLVIIVVVSMMTKRPDLSEDQILDIVLADAKNGVISPSARNGTLTIASHFLLLILFLETENSVILRKKERIRCKLVKSIQDEHEFFSSLFDMLNAHMGQNTELALFDCSTGEPVITDIRNGHISNRHLGDTGNTNDACPCLKGKKILVQIAVLIIKQWAYSSPFRLCCSRG